MRIAVLNLVLTMMITGCVSHVPENIRTSVPGSPVLSDIRSEVENYFGARVRWGGQIISTNNKRDESQVEIVARELLSSGRPEQRDYSPGRFFAMIPGYVDPAIYSEGREITVYGVLTESVVANIGEYPYRYPLVRVEQHHLWQPLVERRYPHHYHPWYDHWDDPWYDPWYRPWRPHRQLHTPMHLHH